MGAKPKITELDRDRIVSPQVNQYIFGFDITVRNIIIVNEGQSSNQVPRDDGHDIGIEMLSEEFHELKQVERDFFRDDIQRSSPVQAVFERDYIWMQCLCSEELQGLQLSLRLEDALNAVYLGLLNYLYRKVFATAIAVQPNVDLLLTFVHF